MRAVREVSAVQKIVQWRGEQRLDGIDAPTRIVAATCKSEVLDDRVHCVGPGALN